LPEAGQNSESLPTVLPMADSARVHRIKDTISIDGPQRYIRFRLEVPSVRNCSDL
jgi:hypothetical protein